METTPRSPTRRPGCRSSTRRIPSRVSGGHLSLDGRKRWRSCGSFFPDAPAGGFSDHEHVCVWEIRAGPPVRSFTSFSGGRSQRRSSRHASGLAFTSGADVNGGSCSARTWASYALDQLFRRSARTDSGLARTRLTEKAR